MPHRKTIALDFDGVIHEYSRGYADGSLYDPPKEGAVIGIRELRKRYRVVVFTARHDLAGVESWLAEYGIEVDGVTNQKPPAFRYVDDRAVVFKSWDSLLTDEKRWDG